MCGTPNQGTNQILYRTRHDMKYRTRPIGRATNIGTATDVSTNFAGDKQIIIACQHNAHPPASGLQPDLTPPPAKQIDMSIILCGAGGARSRTHWQATDDKQRDENGWPGRTDRALGCVVRSACSAGRTAQGFALAASLRCAGA